MWPLTLLKASGTAAFAVRRVAAWGAGKWCSFPMGVEGQLTPGSIDCCQRPRAVQRTASGRAREKCAVRTAR